MAIDSLGADTEQETQEGRVGLMFSGGVDSTTAAIALSRRFREVHLLTYGNGYGHYRIERTARRVRELRRVAGDRFVHTIESVKPFFEELVVDDLLGEFRRYRSGFVWCLGCKMAMHTQSILHCLEHGIGTMADGSSRSTGEMVEQSLLSLYMFRELYADYGIDFTTPVYTTPRDQEIEQLKAQGFRMGFRIGDRFLGVQPKCRPGELYYLPFLLFDQPPRHDDEAVARFIEAKSEVARRIIARRRKEDGIPERVGEEVG